MPSERPPAWGREPSRPVRLLAPLDGSDWDTSPATGSFYFQASDGSVSLPAAGYDYDIDWTPVSAGGAAFTTASVPIVPPAPGRFAITKGLELHPHVVIMFTLDFW